MDTTILDLDRLPGRDNESLDENSLIRASKSVIKLDKDLTKAKVNRFVTNTRLRYYLAIWASLLISCWLWKVGELVMNSKKHELSDGVLIALLTTTTANVLGIIAIVMKDLFNGGSEQGIT
ncbi:MAG: hypothetical protein QE487_15950 [Fluviicola sp.]|nr:hypothetical protein [Fluviicola sp.]